MDVEESKNQLAKTYLGLNKKKKTKRQKRTGWRDGSASGAAGQLLEALKSE